MPTSSIADDNLLTMAFSLRSSPGAYALLVGAGVSAPSGVPTSWGVLTDLIARLAELSGETADDPEVWFEQKYGRPARYETVLEKLAPQPLERQRLLREYFEPTEDDTAAGRKAPTTAHKAIAQLVRAGAVRVIITLNFDRLMERALREAGIEPTIVASPADVHGLAPLHTLSCCVIHLHGDYLNPTSMRNTSTELEEYDATSLALLHRILDDYGLIVAGWSSVHDPALRAAIAEHYPARFTLMWVEPAEQDQVATDLLTLKKGLLIRADADSALGRLADAVESLTTRHARHPATVAIAAETAKRELSGQWVAIRLHDILAVEFERLRTLDAFRLSDADVDESGARYRELVDHVEEASKVACAIVAVLAYWGHDDTVDWWIDEVRRSAEQTRGSGLDTVLRLRLVTGSALMYSAGVAAIAAKRYDVIARLATTEHEQPSGSEPEPVFESLAADELDETDVHNQPLRLHTLVTSVLTEALALGAHPLDEAWQVFEILRLSSLLMTDPSFDEGYDELRKRENELWDAQELLDAAEQSYDPLVQREARDARATASYDRNRALDYLANLVAAEQPHVLTGDLFSNGRWGAPLAERLYKAIEIDGSDHLLIRAGLAPDPPALAAAVRAVSAALGRRGRRLAFGLAVGNGGSVADQLWLDTGEAPTHRSGTV